MKSRCLLMAAFALMLVSCAKDAESVDSTPIEKGNTNVVAQQPVSFGAYVNRATTRAGAAGELTNDGANGKVSLQDEGFGVFAYFTDDKPYTPDYNPNFMYNTQVTYDASANAWTYSPMRYWPNENSANDASEGIDRLSFFAYAPHVNVSPLTGMVDANDSPDSGIVYMSRNGAEGDPFVNYIVNFDPAKQVDFCWGTPQVDMTKPEVSDPVEFEFNHTLAALNVRIDALLDKVDPNTKIFVRSVSFEGFADRGSFNLNTPADKLIWYDVTGRDYIEGGKVTVYDGRTNGHEGSSEAVNELPNGLNPVIVQSAKYSDAALTDGVTTTVVNLFGSASNDAPILVIPTGQPLKVTIVYDVETLVPTLPGYLSDGVTHGTSVENNISKSITLNTGENIKMEAGKKYTLNLHLGLTSMNFDATVSDWAVGASGDADLPINTSTTPAPGPTPTVGHFRGFEISKGILKKETNGDYVLTDGTDQLESVSWIAEAGSVGVYYHRWSQLKIDLGADGNGIKANSDKLPVGWVMPSNSDWRAILGPSTDITINGVAVQYGYALVQVTDITVCGRNTNLPGILIIPDETDIICTNLKTEYVGPDFPYDAPFGRDLSADDISSLTGQGCVFLPCMGYYATTWLNGEGDEYADFGHYPAATDSNQIVGGYWSCTGILDPDDGDISMGMLYGYVDIAFDDFDPDYYDEDDFNTWLYYLIVRGLWMSESDDCYHPVRLVKKMN